jgi:hypothetical protein
MLNSYSNKYLPFLPFFFWLVFFSMHLDWYLWEFLEEELSQKGATRLTNLIIVGELKAKELKDEKEERAKLLSIYK